MMKVQPIEMRIPEVGDLVHHDLKSYFNKVFIVLDISELLTKTTTLYGNPSYEYKCKTCTYFDILDKDILQYDILVPSFAQYMRII